MNNYLHTHWKLIIINLSVGERTFITSSASDDQKLTRSCVDVHFNECTFQAHHSYEKSDGGTCDSGFGCNDLRPTNFGPIDRDMFVTWCSLVYRNEDCQYSSDDLHVPDISKFTGPQRWDIIVSKKFTILTRVILSTKFTLNNTVRDQYVAVYLSNSWYNIYLYGIILIIFPFFSSLV